MVDLRAANHTNRELELMLAGKKPLAMFYDEIGGLPNEEIIPEEHFRPYVEAGRFVRDEVVYNQGFHAGLGRDAQIKYVFFALAEEAWRIPALRLVQSVFRRTGRHTEEIERMESSLLGYTAEEVDAWCDHQFRNRRT
jgi:hypothetical protein